MSLPLPTVLQSCRRVLGQLQRPVLSFTLSLGLATAGWLSGPVTMEALAESEPSQSIQSEVVQTQPLQTSLADGIYFYGQVPQTGQFGVEYVVFQVVDQQAIGAFFMPSSSYDCFHGEITPDRMDLTVIGSYDQTPSNYAIALSPAMTLTAAAGETAVPLSLAGYHPIDTVSAAEQELLATCVVDLQPELAL
ncbi:MAG: hypothetical protein AAF215_13015 [Cyanobacteria bacterium P01_A01_bin.123]